MEIVSSLQIKSTLSMCHERYVTISSVSFIVFPSHGNIIQSVFSFLCLFKFFLKFHPTKESPLIFTISVPYHVASSFYLNCNGLHPDEGRQCLLKH